MRVNDRCVKRRCLHVATFLRVTVETISVCDALTRRSDVIFFKLHFQSTEATHLITRYFRLVCLLCRFSSSPAEKLSSLCLDPAFVAPSHLVGPIGPTRDSPLPPRSSSSPFRALLDIVDASDGGFTCYCAGTSLQPDISIVRFARTTCTYIRCTFDALYAAQLRSHCLRRARRPPRLSQFITRLITPPGNFISLPPADCTRRTRRVR